MSGALAVDGERTTGQDVRTANGERGGSAGARRRRAQAPAWGSAGGLTAHRCPAVSPFPASASSATPALRRPRAAPRPPCRDRLHGARQHCQEQPGPRGPRQDAGEAACDICNSRGATRESHARARWPRTRPPRAHATCLQRLPSRRCARWGCAVVGVVEATSRARAVAPRASHHLTCLVPLSPLLRECPVQVDNIGDVTVTNDGATILKQLEVEHPAARVR